MKKKEKKKTTTTHERENPPWQDLNPFLLSKIFSFLSLQDQIQAVPCVCRSWLSAALHALFPDSHLDLRPIDGLDNEAHRLRFHCLLKLAVNRHRDWLAVSLPRKHALEYFPTIYVASRTPRVSSLVCPTDAPPDVFPVFVGLIYWRNLRVLRVGLEKGSGVVPFLSQLGDYCANLAEFSVHGEFRGREMGCLVQVLPLLRALDLSGSTVSSDALAMVLDGSLKRIRELNVLHCLFLDEDGEDVRKDYFKRKRFKEEVLEKVARLKSLKNFISCLGDSCHDCEGA